MGIDDAGDVAGDVLRVRHWAHILDLGPRVDHAGVHEHEPGRMVDRPNEHGPSLALDEELCREVRANHVPTLPLAACFAEPSSGLERETPPYRVGGPVLVRSRWPG